MSQKVSIWALVGVAVTALMLMAFNAHTSTSEVTGNIIGPRPPRATPAPTPPIGLEMAQRPHMAEDSTGIDRAAYTAMAEKMAKIEQHQCYLINLQLDRDAGKQTPVELISKTCPRWV